MMPRAYRYVGPPEIRDRAVGRPGGTEIRNPNDVLKWAIEGSEEFSSDTLLAATFVIDVRRRLLIADRRSEYVACASGGDVFSAGEIFFAKDGRTVRVAEISNQSTGYCPEPESWEVVRAVLEQIGLEHPGEFTTECVFRRCVTCGERNIVKDGWFRCDVCGTELPREWNFDPNEK
jgi:hypothetical protein